MAAAASYTTGSSCKPAPKMISPMGSWRMEVIDDELKAAFDGLRDDEICTTMQYQMQMFMALTLNDVQVQTLLWRDQGVKCRLCNLREVDVGSKKAWLIVIQPADITTAPLCPVALATGMMVSGFSYVFKTKRQAMTVLAALNAKDRDPIELLRGLKA